MQGRPPARGSLGVVCAFRLREQGARVARGVNLVIRDGTHEEVFGRDLVAVLVLSERAGVQCDVLHTLHARHRGAECLR
eukprot:6807331-Prymnesium_polylepis.1